MCGQAFLVVWQGTHPCQHLQGQGARRPSEANVLALIQLFCCGPCFIDEGGVLLSGLRLLLRTTSSNENLVFCCGYEGHLATWQFNPDTAAAPVDKIITKYGEYVPLVNIGWMRLAL